MLAGCLSNGIHAADLVQESEEEVDSSPGSPPLDTDDPGTPGQQGIEVNFTTSCDSIKHAGRECEFLVDANYGFGDIVQFKVERPYEFSKERGEPSTSTLGATEFGLKYRFLDRDGLQIAVYPQFTINDARETEGDEVLLPLIVAKQFGEYTTVVANLGFEKGLESDGKRSFIGGLAVGRALPNGGKLLGEVFTNGGSKDDEPARTDVRIGYAQGLFPTLLQTTRWEVSAYGSLGQSVHSGDGEHFTALLGFSVVKKPAGE